MSKRKALPGQIEEFLNLLNQLPPDRRAWFIGQCKRLDRGEPSVFDGSVPNPYAEVTPNET